MLHFERNFETLNLCVDSIKGQFAQILGKHENDFIRSYKVTSIYNLIIN